MAAEAPDRLQPAEAPAAPASAGRPGVLRRVAGRPGGLVGLASTGGIVALALLAPVLAPFDPLSPIGPPLAPPGAPHWMGTDALGRDLLSGILFGARTSLLVAGSVGAITLLIGVAIGGVSGFAGGAADDVLMRLTELLQGLPRFFLAIVAIAMFGPGLDRLIVVLAATSWPLLARVLRAEVLSLREREFVQAARAVGASAPRILVRHVLPNALPAALVYLDSSSPR